MREQLRRRLIDQMGDEALKKLAVDIHWEG